MRSASFLAVDCGASHLAVGRFCRLPDGRFALDACATEALASHPPDDQSWMQATSAALQRFGLEKRWRGPCLVGLPGHLTLHKTIRIPRVALRQRRKIIRFEVGQCLPCPESEVRWNQVPVAADQDGEELVISAVRAATMAALCTALRRAGLHPVAAFPAWLALWKGFTAGNPPASSGMVMEIGARSTLLVAGGVGAFFARTIALGGEGVTQGIADQLSATLDRAESIKRRANRGAAEPAVSAPEDMAVQIATDQFIRRLDGEILRSLASLGPAGDARRPTILHVTGGGSLLVNLEQILAASLNLRVERWDGPAAGGAGLGATEPAGTLGRSHRTDLVCLAQCAAGCETAATDLLSPAARRTQIVRRWWPGIAAAALLAVVGPLIALRLARTAVRDSRRETAELEARISARRRLEAREHTALNGLAEANGRIGAAQRLSAARSGWILFAADLQERLAKTGDAWLERLQPAPDAPAHKPPPKDEKSHSGVRAPDPAFRFCLSACLFDPQHPQDKPGAASYQRARELLTDLRQSPFLDAVEAERFDAGQPGILRLEVTLVLAPGKLF